MSQKMVVEEVASTTTTRIESRVGAMLAAVAWHHDTSSAEILTPLVRRAVESWFEEIPEEIRRRFLNRLDSQPSPLPAA